MLYSLQNESGLCLGEFCNVFNCDAIEKLGVDNDEVISSKDSLIPCTAAEVEKTKYRCNLFMNRCVCCLYLFRIMVITVFNIKIDFS